MHYVVPGGGVVLDKSAKPTGSTNFIVHHPTLIAVYKAKLAHALRECDLYDVVPAEAWMKKFVVDIEAVDDGRSVVAYLAPYVHRVAISDHRIKSVDADSVTYQYMPSKTHTLKTRTVTGPQFVTGFTQHILPKGFRKVRYHGWMCSHSKTRLEEIRIIVWMTLGWIYWLASGHAPRAKPRKVLPFRCDRCQSQMKVCAVVFQSVCLERLNQSPATIDSS